MKLKLAILISVIAHVGLIALLVVNYKFSKVELKQSSAPVTQINVKAINSQRIEQLVKNIKDEKLEQQRKEKKRLEDLKKAEQEAQRKRKEEERKANEARLRQEQAEQKRKEEESKAADLKKKRIAEEQERKRQAEAEKKQKEAAEKKRKAEAEAKRKAEAERKRKEEERKRKAREEAERKRKEAEEKARQEALEREMQAQMEAEAAELQAAHHAQVMNEVDKYITLIQGIIKRNWIEPEQLGMCKFKIKIAPGGLVIDVNVVEGGTQHCDSGRRAIYKSEPLPLSKDPDVFEQLKSINLTLDNRDNEAKN
ncbi:cell envelope integrity protein TolA [Aliikangiella maris]|uniref:Cell envelope integrity protein TolA n=2 Tax=Aliikangiella maris TaxID=3162458 RepID=A0ABV3MQM0_9GAMM